MVILALALSFLAERSSDKITQARYFFSASLFLRTFSKNVPSDLDAFTNRVAFVLIKIEEPAVAVKSKRYYLAQTRARLGRRIKVRLVKMIVR